MSGLPTVAGHRRVPARARRAVVLAATAAAAVTAAATPRALAVTGGVPDGTAHPYVGALVAPGGTAPTCTAELVRGDAGRVVALTDAHCLYRNGRHNGTGAVVTFTPTWSPTAPKYTGPWYVDPAYDPVHHLHDLAAIVLRSFPAVAPGQLATVGTAAARPVGSVLTVVGIGSPYQGERRWATEVVTGHDASWLYLKPGSGNTCAYDSGGPDLIPTTRIIVALTDLGTCSYDQDTRVDTVEAHAFVTAAATWPTTPLALSLTLSAATVTAGHSVVASGTTSALYSGETVLRQGLYGGAWHTWATGVVGPTGGYSFTITPTVVTTDYYRIYLPASATHPAGASRTVALQVIS